MKTMSATRDIGVGAVFEFKKEIPNKGVCDGAN